MNKKNPSYIHFIIEANSEQTDTVFPYYEHVYNQKYPRNLYCEKLLILFQKCKNLYKFTLDELLDSVGNKLRVFTTLNLSIILQNYKNLFDIEYVNGETIYVFDKNIVYIHITDSRENKVKPYNEKIKIDIVDLQNTEQTYTYDMTKYINQRNITIDKYIKNIKTIITALLNNKIPWTIKEIIKRPKFTTIWSVATTSKYIHHVIKTYPELFKKCEGGKYVLNITQLKTIDFIKEYETVNVETVVKEDIKIFKKKICFVVFNSDMKTTYNKLYDIPEMFLKNKHINMTEYCDSIQKIITELSVLEYQTYSELEKKFVHVVFKHSTLFSYLRHIKTYYPEILSILNINKNKGKYKLLVNVGRVCCCKTEQDIPPEYVLDHDNVYIDKNVITQNKVEAPNIVEVSQEKIKSISAFDTECDECRYIVQLAYYLVKEFDGKRKEKLIDCEDWQYLKQAINNYFEKNV